MEKFGQLVIQTESDGQEFLVVEYRFGGYKSTEFDKVHFPLPKTWSEENAQMALATLKEARQHLAANFKHDPNHILMRATVATWHTKSADLVDWDFA